MPVFLSLVEPAEAWRRMSARLRLPDPLPWEQIDVSLAAGRVTAQAVTAAHSTPAYHGAAMDGFVVHARETRGASEATPVRLRKGEQARPVDTGDEIPPGFDAVVKVEDVHEPAPDTIEIVAAVSPWQHVRLTGEDLVATELVVPQGKWLTPYDIGALLASGVARIAVRRMPRVALIASGDELVEAGTPPRPGQIIEFNTHMLAALVRGWGGEPLRPPRVPDQRAALEAAVRTALSTADIVVLNAGSSAGRDDYTSAVLSQVGELLFHGINVMPGKPSCASVTLTGQVVLGLPGYPVSCMVAAERLLRPLVAAHLGVAPPERDRVRARIARKIPSKIGHEEVLRVQVGRVGDGWTVAPLPRGAGVVSSLSRANGLMTVPPLVEGYEPGQEADIELLVPRAEAERTLVHVGSHDMALDYLGDVLRRRHPGRSLASANVGSLGGLYALDRGECHFSGTHLIDPETGEYNVPYIRRVCLRKKVALVSMCEREQGLTVARGNPLGIRGFADLARPDVRFVNRQRGAGTRVLLDMRLGSLGIDPASIRGYEHEEHTHMASAVAIASGVADCALTIRAAAVALGLDFVPLERERYELALPAADLETPAIAALLDALRSPEFRTAAEALGGYSAAGAGTDVREI